MPRARLYRSPPEAPSATVVPRRPSVRITPDRVSCDQAADTVVGESASSAATVRIGGSLVPGASARSETARLTAAARPREVGRSRRCSISDSRSRMFVTVQ
ncbi:MAG TPA: hypothetical protein VFT75_14655 [Nocardioidaceae bacterium]|nr:hypothetical protein [Nocardioidaceae bacterium]